MSARLRRFRHTTAVAALLASCFAAAPATAAEPTRKPSPAPAQRFAPVALPPAARGAVPVTVHAPAPRDVWVAARGRDGRLLLLRQQNGRWTVHGTTVRVAAGERVTLDGLTSSEVWAVAGGTLLRFDGRRWRNAGERGVIYTTVSDAPGTGAYYGRSPVAPGSREAVGRLDRRLRHSTLSASFGEANGNPSNLGALRVVGSRVFAEWSGQEFNTGSTHVWEYVGGRWEDRYTHGWRAPREGDITPHAWLVQRGGRLLSLGGFAKRQSGDLTGTCTTWSPLKGAAECATSGVVGAADTRSDGRVVIGGNAGIENGRPVPATFRLREAGGRERVVPGDPGRSTVSLSVEPRTDVAWAITTTGRKVHLQTAR